MLKLVGAKLICESKVVAGKYGTTQKISYISVGGWKQQTESLNVAMAGAIVLSKVRGNN